jgi:hypothetical protein
MGETEEMSTLSTVAEKNLTTPFWWRKFDDGLARTSETII